MARIDYFAIEQAIQTVLQDDPDLAGVEVLIEEDAALTEGDAITIWPRRRDAPSAQSMSAGTRTTYNILFSVWCFGQSLNKAEAIRQRDDLVGRAEIALMQNRTLNDAVKHLRLGGGEFFRRDDSAFIRGAEIEVVVDKTAIT